MSTRREVILPRLCEKRQTRVYAICCEAGSGKPLAQQLQKINIAV